MPSVEPATAQPPPVPPVPPEATATSVDDIPGGPVWGNRTLTGTVAKAGMCTTLLTGAGRWALTGTTANALVDGARVTVTGTLTPMPPECSAQELLQAVLVSRADPA
jgi:hypothetical protein